VNETATQAAISFYKQFVKGELHPTNARTAELCKLTENASRDVQIAFANELSLICDKAGIDVWDLIRLANKHPRVNILKPGCGVGGHCIAVDPYFIVADYPQDSQIISKAREINNHKSLWCAEKVKIAKLEFQLKNGRSANIAVMGLAFKPNIDDLRESPAVHIAKAILNESKGSTCYFVEPNIKEHDLFKLAHMQEAVDNSDIIVLLVAHDDFLNLDIDKSKVVLDFCGLNFVKDKI
jgi:UDP-N-acetyl-D-mannosaminuronic acid dehydrogenase